MNQRQLRGKKVSGFHWKWGYPDYDKRVQDLRSITFTDGTSLVFHTVEGEGDYYIAATLYDAEGNEL